MIEVVTALVEVTAIVLVIMTNIDNSHTSNNNNE